MVDRSSRLPLFYREYSGNEHDSQVFNQVIDEMFGVLCGFTCVIALTMKRLLELQVEPVLGTVSAEKIIEELRALRSVLVWHPGKKHPRQQLEEPTQLQNDVLKVFGYGVNDSWVLHQLSV